MRKWQPGNDAFAGHVVVVGASTQPLPPDDVLVGRLQDRDEATFTMLMNAWSGGMLRLARCLVSDDDAAEVVRDTWLAVVRAIGSFQGRPSLKCWVHRHLVDTAGRREARPEPETDDPHPTVDPARFQDPGEPYPRHWREFPAPWRSPEHGAPPADEQAQAAAALARLPYHERLVVTLGDLEGFSPDEVCSILDIPTASQRVLLHRARAFVRCRLEDYFRAPGMATS